MARADDARRSTSRTRSGAFAALLGCLALGALAVGCGADGEGTGGSSGPAAAEPVPVVSSGASSGASPDGSATAPGVAAADPEDLPVVVFLGDSLTAGYGLAEDQAWPAVLEERFAREGQPFRAVNAGSSGDTSAGGVRRLDWVLRRLPDVVVVELGANEGLRGLELAPVEENLRQVVERSRRAGARVLLVGLRIPPNYGPEYTRRFAEIYPRLAAELDVPLVPFLLEGVGGEPSLNLGDGIHPNAAGHRRVADVVAPYLRPLVAAAAAQELEAEAG